MTSDILFARKRDWGVITLNREKALNALTWDMIKAMRAQLTAWAGDKSVKSVLVKGAGGRAFCAGGDLRWLYDHCREDPRPGCEFFRDEYTNNALIYHYPKPYVALIDGVVMGGGVGISVHGDFRVAGDATLFAMPETAVGLFPDIGGGHFLPRMHDGLGLYYALTGARGNAADCVANGVATHYVASAHHAALEVALLGETLGAHAHADIEAILDEFSEDPGHAPINDIRPAVARLFQGHETLEDLMTALKQDEGEFAGETLKTLSRMSPTSMRIAFEQLKRGLSLDFDDDMKMEFRIACRVLEGHDLYEGIRAIIIDKDRNPNWSPLTIEGIDDRDITHYFETLGDDELILP